MIRFAKYWVFSSFILLNRNLIRAYLGIKYLQNIFNQLFMESHVTLYNMIFSFWYFQFFQFIIFVSIKKWNKSFEKSYFVKMGYIRYFLTEEVLGCMKNIVFIDFACNRWDFFGSREFQDLVFVFDGMLWRYKRRMGLQFGYYVNKKELIW